MSLVSQMRGFIFLYFKSSRPSSSKPLTAYLYKPFKRYGSEGASNKDQNISSLHPERHGRAPSIAEEFERVAEEKLRAAGQGVASQTKDKVYDGAEESTRGGSNVDSVKNRFEEHEQGADYRGRGD
ncbi:hypothetical protein CISIN_1g033183mg [Citrus sinensis]|uniref:Uncharacterized protein n=1 Tax=Citrus sinensis TaxID=2711 RepID=A0A067FFY2_CITSI|nr:hypothetical protein CISIN_1g033183mg [Citrus sinensis]